jgi:uncharacterized protein YyaL (SSP411 family)
MARCLYRLGAILDKEDWREMAVQMTSKLSSIISSEPTYMSNWGMLFAEIAVGFNEVVISGNELDEMRREIQSHYLPFAVYAGTKLQSVLPLLEGRESIDGKTKIYICRDKACQLPVDNAAAAINQILAQ